jgi:hypothetical protein
LTFCGKESEAKAYLEANLKGLLSAQIDDEGKQMLEMSRVKSKHYGNFNLVLLVRLAKISKSLGVDVWNYQDDEGRGSIRKAMNYMADCYVDPGKWTFSDEENDPIITRSWIKDGVVLYDDPVLIDVHDKVRVRNFTNVPDFVSLPN